MKTILLIEDEESVANVIKKGLEEDAYKIITSNNGLTGIELLKKNEIDLILLDILLPNISGLETCKMIRELGYKSLPILMLTALGSAENVVLGLDSGADDYLSKPFKLIELKARIRTLIRRGSIESNDSKKIANIYTFNNLEVNNDAKTVTRDGYDISLTSTEFRLLLMFIKNPNKVLSRTDLLDEVWGINFDMGTNVVDVYVNYLRKKLEKHNKERIINTVIGMGYILK